MKAITALAVCILAAAYTHAQTVKGDLLLGGSGNYSTIDKITYPSGIHSKGYSFFALTHEGFLISDHIAAGIISGYSKSQTFAKDEANNNEITEKSKGFSGGLFLRYYKYFGEAGKFAVIVEPRMQVTGLRQQTSQFNKGSGLTYTTAGSSDYSLEASINPSIAYFFTNKCSIELSAGGVGYRSTEYTPVVSATEYPHRTRSFYADLDLFSPSLGVMFSL